MKKSISGITAFAIAVVTAVSSIPMTVAYGEDVIDVYEEDYYMPYEPGVSATSDKDDQAMKEALTIVKRRVTVPEEISEFTYSTSLSYGTKSFNFNWTTPNDAKEHKYVKVSIVGNIITDYTYFDGTTSRSGPRFAKMTEDQLLEKAKEHIKKLDPTIADKTEVTLSYFGLNSNYVNINIRRFENGIPVNNNGGSITLDKDTGELKSFSITWADNAVFSDTGTVKTEAEIREAYKQICNLTPYYKSTTDWNTKKVTTRIVYDPDMTSEIDAFTGQPSTIWDDMKSAEGTRFSSTAYVENPMTGAGNYDEVSADGAIFDGVEFTKEELKKIQQDKKLLTKEQVTEILKKDKFVALTDDYVISSYRASGEKYPIMLLDNDKGISTPDKDKETEKFYIDAVYTIKSELKNSYSGYKYITVQLDGETGEILSMRKGNADNNELPKLDVQKSRAIADEVAKTYCKDIIKEYKASASNSDPAQTWTVRVGGKDVERSETARTFTYKRYVNGIQVYADSISVRVDSNGVVTLYDCYHSENAAFPSADDILTPEQAFDKLYQQQKFDYYYDGWIGRDGSAKTYLVYKMDGFHLNAKSGKLCFYNGEPLNNKVSSGDVKYTDIKGIPEEQAILTMQKYGVVLTTDSKFDPTGEINENEFRDLLTSALNDEVAVLTEGSESEKPKALTREMAAVIFTSCYNPGRIVNLKGIYTTPFSDVKSTDDSIGYIAIAYARGFISKGDGKFNGSKKITRAEAMQMLYDYILLLSAEDK